MMATKLSSTLVAPSKVANILDWRRSVGAVMGLDITRERIGLALAEHPENARESAPLRSLSLGSGSKSRLSEDVVSELEAAVRRHRVCAFVVHWPAREGRSGERCGKVLQVLDSVVEKSSAVVSRKRPFALWTASGGAAAREPSPTDAWGRSAAFARAPAYSQDASYSSKSAAGRTSSVDASEVAACILEEWVREHWEVEGSADKATYSMRGSTKDFYFGTRSADESNSENTYVQAALL